METKNRRQVPVLIKELLEKPREFSFVQAVRLLRSQVVSGQNGKPSSSGETAIRFRPKLSLDFPPTDIDTIEALDGKGERYMVTATFLGLYGTSSPLPAFYTEELFEDASEDIAVTRDFLDIFHTPVYRLFFHAATRYRLPFQVVEEKDSEILERLYSLLGYAGRTMRKSLPSAYRMLRYIGLFTHFPRSAAALRSLVADLVGTGSVTVEQCIASRAAIPEEQRCRLGSRAGKLGADSYIGSRIHERSGAFRMTIGPLDHAAYHALLPGTVKAVMLQRYVQLYLDQPLRWDVDLSIDPCAVEGVTLGRARWSCLGEDSWVGTPGSFASSSTVRFYPHQLNPELRQHSASV